MYQSDLLDLSSIILTQKTDFILALHNQVGQIFGKGNQNLPPLAINIYDVSYLEIHTSTGQTTVEFFLYREEVLPPILTSPQLMHLEEQML